MFRMMFGGGKFEKEFGELSFGELLNKSDNEINDQFNEQLQKIQQERKEKLIHHLLIKLEPFIWNNVKCMNETNFPNILLSPFNIIVLLNSSTRKQTDNKLSRTKNRHYKG
jgi:methionyl-tRNA synthetase